jgi:hypothetical protein
MIRLVLIVGVIAAFLSPAFRGTVTDAASDLFAPEAETSAEQQRTYDRLCPLFEVWVDLDADGKQATTRTIRRLADKQAETTTDPALKAVLNVVPDALSSGSSVQSKAARALISRECDAHHN